MFQSHSNQPLGQMHGPTLTRPISFLAEPSLDGVDFEDLVPGGLDQLLRLTEMRLHDLDVADP